MTQTPQTDATEPNRTKKSAAPLAIVARPSRKARHDDGTQRRTAHGAQDRYGDAGHQIARVMIADQSTTVAATKARAIRIGVSSMMVRSMVRLPICFTGRMYYTRRVYASTVVHAAWMLGLAGMSVAGGPLSSEDFDSATFAPQHGR